jgi:hypothetical protein
MVILPFAIILSKGVMQKKENLVEHIKENTRRSDAGVR